MGFTNDAYVEVTEDDDIWLVLRRKLSGMCLLSEIEDEKPSTKVIQNEHLTLRSFYLRPQTTYSYQHCVARCMV